MGRKSRSRSRDRSEKKTKHKDRRSRSRSRGRRDDKRDDKRDDRRDDRRDRDRDDRKDIRRDDRRDDRDRRDHREKTFERPPERIGGGWNQQAAAAAGSMQNYEDKIKNLIASRGQGLTTKWGAAPENMKIHDENGEISEEFLRSTQGPANSQKLVQQELSIKFSQHLSNSKTIKPKIDQSSF